LENARIRVSCHLRIAAIWARDGSARVSLTWLAWRREQDRGGKEMNKRGAKKRAKSGNRFKIVVEKHKDGYEAYPLGLKGVLLGEGDTYEEAVADVKSAIRFHVDTFGKSVLDAEDVALEAFVAEAEVTC